MSFWLETGILNNNATKHRCYRKAYLLEKADDSIVKKRFCYDIISDTTYQETNGFTGEYTVKSKTIYTPNYTLNFCRGARVEFIGGEQLIIKSINEVTDSQKALADGKGLIGLELIF